MDLTFLQENAAWFAYELRKFFPTGEVPVAHYVCEENVIVLSNKRIFIFYVGTVIDYREDTIPNLVIKDNNEETGEVEFIVKGKTMKVKFKELSDYTKCMNYIKKYKD